MLEEVAQVGTDGFAIDEQLNLTYVRDVARKYKVGFGGNLKLTLALSLGILSPREDAIISLAAGGLRGSFSPQGETCPTMFRWNTWIKRSRRWSGTTPITQSILII